MSSTTSAFVDTTAPGLNCQDAEAGEIAPLLERWFGIRFSVLNTNTAEYLRRGELCPAGNPAVYAEMCRELIDRGSPEFIAEDDPIVLLAIPIPTQAGPPLVALAPFILRNCDESSIVHAASIVGCDQMQIAQWLKSTSPWDATRLLTMAELAVSNLTNQLRAEKTLSEMDALSQHLLTTYDEISLLYRLTQKLKLSGSNEDLGRAALRWLEEAIPAEAFALQLSPKLATQQDHSDENTPTPVLISQGKCPIDSAEFSNLIKQLRLDQPPSLAIINPQKRHDLSSSLAAQRQFILVPLVEGDRLFGWLAAFNRCHHDEFASTEINLLSSVAAILSIHAANVELYQQQQEFLACVVRALTSAIDAKDPYTCGHSDRVARVAVLLAKRLGCSAKECEIVYLSGLLHDIGKIGIDDHVLRKPGKLTGAEYENIKLHAEIGFRILKGIKQLDQVLPVVRHHHEAWNGKGYPCGLRGEQIPLFARIVSVADAFDAMSSDRPYRKGIPDDQLDHILSDGAGKQWDSHIVDAFFAIRDDIRGIVHSDCTSPPVKMVHDVVVPFELSTVDYNVALPIT